MDSSAPPVIDVHQHLWPPALIGALEARTGLPRLVVGDDAWELRIAGEPRFPTSVSVHDPRVRRAADRLHGVTHSIVALSSALGVEALPAEQAQPLIDAWEDGARALPDHWSWWAAARLDHPDPARLRASLADGAVGLCLPAGALARPRDWDALGMLLDVLEQVDVPLFAHPGPGLGDPRAPRTDVPGWWPAVTDYVAQMHAAWTGWSTSAQRNHPSLRVLFAFGAGLAPLQSSRVALRSGSPLTGTVRSFYDSSSYGPDALAALAGVVGWEQIVLGSDLPTGRHRTAAELGHPAPLAALRSLLPTLDAARTGAPVTALRPSTSRREALIAHG